MTNSVAVVRDPIAATALLASGRTTLLEHLATPDSASGVARKLGLPRQQVNYHLRELERHGFLEFVEERRKGNCIERVVRAASSSYLLSSEALGRLGDPPPATQDRFSAAYLVSRAARIIRDLGLLGLRASRAGKKLATLTIEAQIRFRSPAERHAFAGELASAVAALAAKYHDETAPDGRTSHVLVGAWPAITKPEEETGRETVRLD